MQNFVNFQTFDEIYLNGRALINQDDKQQIKNFLWGINIHKVALNKILRKPLRTFFTGLTTFKHE